MMKMITQTNGLNFFSQLSKQVLACCGFFLLLTTTAFGQCPPGTSSWGSATLSGLDNVLVISTCSYAASEWAPVYGAQSGDELSFVLNEAGDGGYITVRIGSPDGEVLGYGPSPLTVIASSDATLYPTWNSSDACENEYSCVTTTVQCVSCVPDCLELGLNYGDSCDDLDPLTVLDTVNENCECVGQAIPDAPINDLACDATEIFCGDVVVGNNQFATNSAPKCDGSQGGNDLWYSYTPDVNSVVTLETCLDGTDFDTDISVFTGSCDELVCEPGFGGNGHIDGASGCSYASWASSGTFIAYAGITYTIQVAGYGSSYVGNFTMSISCEEGDPTPYNDICENAPLLLCGVNTSGSTEYANPALEGQTFCGTSSTTAPGVWYSLFTVEAGPVIIDLSGSSFDTKLFVYTGLCGQLECLDGNDDGGEGNTSLVQFEASAATYYYIYVTGYGSNSGEYNIAISCGYDCNELQAYIGDSCDDLNDGTYNDLVTENCECAGTPYDCQELGLNFGVACDDENEGTENDIVTEDCECVGTEIPQAPENDLICDAIEITCGENQEGTTISATIDDAGFCGTSNTAPGVWYNLSVDFDGSIEFSLCDAATFDTKISVFAGDDCSAELECIGGNDDGSGCSGFTSKVSLDVSNGQNLFVLVHGFSSATGDFVLSASCEIGVDCPELGLNIGAACDDGNPGTTSDTVTDDCECIGQPVPENDLCENAIAVECGSITSGTTINASSESQVFCGTSNGSAGAVWYSYTATENAIVTTGVCGADYDSKLRVYEGICGELVCITGEDDDFTNCAGNDPILDFEAEEGITYFILVHGFSSYEGNFDLTIDCEAILDCSELEANIGDACDDENDLTENDTVNENCGCEGTPVVVSDCQDWVVYLNNNEGGVSDIYSVDLSSGDAELTYITTIDYHSHITYNPADNLIYVLHNGNGSYVTVNPHTAVPEVSAQIFLSQSIPSITTAAFAPNGKLIVGSATQNILYSINTADQMVNVFDGYSPINGGDIAFDSNGMLYMATRSGNGLYQVFPDDVLADQLIGNLPSLVTGMALTDTEQLITSHNGNAALRLRNLDGSNAGISFPLMLDGNAFDHNDGDMASGCNTYQDNNEGDCDEFNTFYVSHGPGISGSNLYSVSYSGSDAILSYLSNVSYEAHIAYNAQDGIVYLVNANGSFIRAFDPVTESFLGDLPIVGNINSLYAVAYNDLDGKLYLGDANDDEIFSVDLGSGVATYYADAPVEGGDLAFQNGEMILATRTGDKLYSIVEGSAAILLGNIPTDVNGMAQANNSSSLIMANTGASVFSEVSAIDGSFLGAYNAILEGEVFTFVNGDMAAGCGDADNVIVPNGQCYATEVLEYVEGTTLGDGTIPANRSDENQVLGAPERIDAVVFTTLGYDGSITVGFDGAVPNGPGDDIEIVETSFNNAGCASYPEFANVYVSVNGIDWLFAGTVCKSEPFVDISNADENLDHVFYVRVANNNDITTSSDGFDVDGIVAIHNCVEGPGIGSTPTVNVAGMSTISSYPNPTAGQSQVVFTTAETGYALVEVYDMNGRNVSTLYNQVAEAGLEYRIDFNGTQLPNGVYIYKLTTKNETIINKFMMTR